jgi:hypothetical protein
MEKRRYIRDGNPLVDERVGRGAHADPLNG